MIPGFYDETKTTVGRLMKGNKKSLIKTQLGNQTKPPKEIRSELEQKKEILRLKKEIDEKQEIQAKLAEL